MKHLIFLFTLTVLYLNGIHGYGNVNPPLTDSYRKCDTQNGLCSTCTDNESPCGFEKQNKGSYYGCIKKGYEFHCCPSGYSYNNNTRDVTCIGEGEELSGHGTQEAIIDHLKWKFCSDPEYPSCKNKSKTKIQHTCTHISKPCNGVCYVGYQIDQSKKFCAKNNTHVPSVNFQSCPEGNNCSCNENQQPCRFNGYPGLNYQGCIKIGYEKNCCPPGFKYNPNSIDVTCIAENEQLLNGIKNDINKRFGETDEPESTKATDAADHTTTIIATSSVGAAFLLLAVIIGGIVYYKRRQRHNVERVDDNPDYDYGEIYDNIEVTDFNPYYMENGEDEEDGKAEIVDHNPLYGVGEDED